MNTIKEFEVRDGRRRDKFNIDDDFIDNFYAKIVGPHAAVVYACLCRHADQYQECYPSIKRIHERTGISEKQIGRSIKTLQDHNLIRKKRMGKKLNNRYFLLDKCEWTVSPITERTTSPITTDTQSDHQGTGSPIHSKDSHFKDSQLKVAGEQPPGSPPSDPELEEPYVLKTDPVSQGIYAYKELRGVPRDNRTWDKLHWARAAKLYREFLEAFQGDLALTVRCMREVGDKLKRDFRDPDQWNLDTIVHKRAGEWLVRHQAAERSRAASEKSRARTEAARATEAELQAASEKAFDDDLRRVRALPADQQSRIREQAEARLKKLNMPASWSRGLTLELEMVEVYREGTSVREAATV